MKKLILAAAALAIGTSIVTAQDTNVYSRNAVGYVKITMRTNSLYLIRNDFVALSAPIAISNAIGQQIPPGSQILRFNEGTQTYLAPIQQNLSGSWGPAGSNRLNRGDAFFVRIPAFNGGSVNSNAYDVYLMGEVPDANTAPTTTINAALGFNFDGFPYPADTRWTNTQFSKNTGPGSQIITWNETNQTYSAPIQKNLAGSWGPSGNALILRPGQGYLVRTTNALTYSEVKPYTWP